MHPRSRYSWPDGSVLSAIFGFAHVPDASNRGCLGHRAGAHDHFVLWSDPGEDLDPDAVIGPDRDLGFLGLAVLDHVDVGLAVLRLAHEARRGQGRVLGGRVEDDLGDAVHPRADPVVGVGQVDLGVHGPRGGVFRLGEPGDLTLEDLGPEGVERDLGGVADVGQRHVAVGDLGDHADLVGPGDRQQGDRCPLRRPSG